MNQQVEEDRLALLLSSPLVGICYLRDKQLVQEFDDDPALREALIEYQRERVRQASLSARTAQRRVKGYPSLD